MQGANISQLQGRRAKLTTMLPNLVAVPLPSASTIAATVSVHILKISGYSQAKLLLCSTGSYIESAKFEAAGHSWRIRVYPNGHREETASYITVFFVLASEQSKDVRANLWYCFLQQDGKLKAKHHRGNKITRFVSYNDSWGFHMAMKRQELERPEYLKDDTILIRCDIAVLNEPVVQRQDLARLELLCDCSDDQCKNLHKESAAAASWNMETLSHDLQVPSAPLPSASSIVVTASTGCHVVQISGYSRTKLLFENGKCVYSAEFTEAGHTWQIACYPNGYNKESAGYMSLFLFLADESRNVHAKFHLSLVPQGKLTGMPHGGGTINTYTFLRKNNGRGIRDFMKIETLENSEYLKDDSLFVRCDITVMNATVAARQDLEALELLCDCKDDLCKNIHAIDKEAAAKAPSKFSSRVLKNIFLRCLPNPSANHESNM